MNEVDRDDVEAGTIAEEEENRAGPSARLFRGAKSCSPTVLSLMELNHIFNEHTTKSI